MRIFFVKRNHSIAGLSLLLTSLSIFAQTASDPSTNSTVSLSGDSIRCVDYFQHLLLHEDSIIVTAKFIAKTSDGNFLIPGYYYPNRGIYYNMPYLIKCTPTGNVLWSKSYPSKGVYPSNWFYASRIKELRNGDLVMAGEIGVPGTDNRRELAVWRLDKNGNQVWAESYENSLWTNPITGSAEVTGIEEDLTGNIFLSGNLKFFEVPRFVFLLKLSSKGSVIWDKSYSIQSPLAYGLLFLQNKLLLIGRSGPLMVLPNIESYLLWCVTINPDDGGIAATKASYADFDQQSSIKSLAFANAGVTLLDNGQIGVFGTANSDYLAYAGQPVDTIWHSIVANFTPDFTFAGGIMLGSTHLTNYYNTIATEHSNGRISYTRFSETQDLYNEDIIYGHIQDGRVSKEKIYHENNRSGATVSNFLFFQPGSDILIQSYNDSTTAKGGLELIRLNDNEKGSECGGVDTSLTLTHPYFMKSATMKVDSILTDNFHFTYHNIVDQVQGNLFQANACQLTSRAEHFSPVVSLDKEIGICEGSSRELSAGPGYSQYAWSNGSTDSAIVVQNAGQYWVTVTDQNGCTGSDTAFITEATKRPAAFLPADTTICFNGTFIIEPLSSYRDYLWSDFSTQSSLAVGRPGLYWLQVTDSNNCTGTDTIRIYEASCSTELLVPNAFTPNGDGLNDIFKPVIFQSVVSLNFTIYNRWGEKVFETRSLEKGWDGRVNGIAEPGGVYVWYCEYQPAGQAPITKRGTVTLVR